MTKQELKNLQKQMIDNGEFSPLFRNTPDEGEALFESVTGKVKPTLYGHALTVKVGDIEQPFNLTNDADPEADTFHIGVFTALRDHQPQRAGSQLIVGGESFRHFAYND